jgi:hypothetical protein
MVGRRKIAKIPPEQTESPSSNADGEPPPPNPPRRKRKPSAEDNRLPATIPSNMPDSYSPALMKALCESIACGVSLSHSLNLLGLSRVYQTWRKADKQFIDEQIAVAESTFVAENLGKIRSATDKSWQAAAWLLERRYPSQFSVNREGKGSNQGTAPVQIMIVSNIPRPYDILRRRGKRIGEPGESPVQIEAVNADAEDAAGIAEAEIIEVVSNVPRRRSDDADD